MDNQGARGTFVALDFRFDPLKERGRPGFVV